MAKIHIPGSKRFHGIHFTGVPDEAWKNIEVLRVVRTETKIKDNVARIIFWALAMFLFGILFGMNFAAVQLSF